MSRFKRDAGLADARCVEPSVQASYMKNVLAALEKQGRVRRLEAEAPDLVRTVTEAPRLRWLPIAWNVRLVEAVAACFGEERGLAILADCVFAQFESPLWRGFIGGAVRLLGREPGSLGRWLPQAFSLVFRDCGQWSVEPDGDGALRVVVRGLPPSVAGHRLWLRSLAIGMTPLFTLCGCSGEARLDAIEAHARCARYRLRWKQSAARSGARSD